MRSIRAGGGRGGKEEQFCKLNDLSQPSHTTFDAPFPTCNKPRPHTYGDKSTCAPTLSTMTQLPIIGTVCGTGGKGSSDAVLLTHALGLWGTMRPYWNVRVGGPGRLPTRTIRAGLPTQLRTDPMQTPATTQGSIFLTKKKSFHLMRNTRQP